MASPSSKDYYASLRRPLRKLAKVIAGPARDPDDEDYKKSVKKYVTKISKALVLILGESPSAIFHDLYVIRIAVFCSMLFRCFVPQREEWPDHMERWFLDVDFNAHQEIVLPTAEELPKDQYKHPSSVEDHSFIVPIHLLSGSPFVNSGNVVKSKGTEDSDVDMDVSAHADEDSDIDMMASAHHTQRQSASPDMATLCEVTIAANDIPDRDILERVTFPVERETMQGPLIRLPLFSCTNCLGHINKEGEFEPCEFRGYGRACTRCSGTNGMRCTFELSPSKVALSIAQQVAPLMNVDLISLKEQLYKVLEQERICLLDYSRWKSSTHLAEMTETNFGVLIGRPNIQFSEIADIIRNSQQA